MKRLIPLLIMCSLLSARAASLPPFVSVPYIASDPTRATNRWWTNSAYDGVTVVQPWQGWQAVDYNFGLIWDWAGSLSDTQTNALTNSRKLVAATISDLTVPHGGWVDLPTVTNFAGVEWTVLQGVPLLYYSTDAGANWAPCRYDLITNTTVWLKLTTQTNIPALDIPTDAIVTNLVFYTLERPDMFGKTNALYGQRTFLPTPLLPDEGANKDYVDRKVAAVSLTNVTTDVQLQGHALYYNEAFETKTTISTNGYEWTLSFLGGDVLSVKEPLPTPVSGASIAMDGTNCVVKVPTNGLTGPPRLQVSHYISPQNWSWLSTVPVVSGTNYVFTFPRPWPDRGFFMSFVPASVPGTFGTASLLKLAPRTVATSTDSTFGYGAGLVSVDGNYLYVSTGTNAWKRVALSSW